MSLNCNLIRGSVYSLKNSEKYKVWNEICLISLVQIDIYTIGFGFKTCCSVG